MKKNRTLSALKRLGSLFLALVMVLSLLPVTAFHAHAAGTVTLTNKAGEVADTFTIGEPIYVETKGYTSNEWFSLWYYNGSWESTYRLWWYATDEEMLLWDAVWKDGFAWDGMNMPAGTYYIYYAESEELASFTLVEPDASVTAEKSLSVVQDGNVVSITAVNYSEYAHVSVKNEDGIAVQKFFCLGRNGLTMEYELTPGEYTISMYNDWDETELADQKTITVEGEKVELLTTDKTEYKFGEPMMVTAQLGNPNWVGLYKQDDTDIRDGGTASIFWAYATPGEAFDLLSACEVQRPEDYKAGTYKVLLLDASYNVLASVENIVITTEIDESKTVITPASCEENGYITYTYTDGTTKTVEWDAIEDPELKEQLKATGHDYAATPVPVEGVVGKHVYTCGNNDAHTKQEDCVWDEGEVTVEPEVGKDGEKTYTCTLCGGKRTEVVSAKEVDHTETFDATCTKGSYKIDYYTDGTNSGEIPTGTAALGHSYGEAVHNEGSDPSNHTKTCTREGCTDAQADHSVTEDCSYSGGAVPGGTRYTCSGCGDFYDVIIMSTNKTEYALGEPILITVNPDVYDETANDWVGIWEGNLSHTDDISIYYYYPASEGWKDFNIKNSSVHQMPNIQKYELGVGTYTLRMYTERNGDWYVPITSLTITIGPAVRDESKTVRVEPTCETDGSITYYLTDGTVEKVVTAEEDPSLKATGHAYPENFTCDNNGLTHSKVCANNPEHVITENCQWNDGVVTEEPTTEKTGVKTYTCGVCNGTKTEELPKVNVTEVSRTVVEPTCEEEGYTLVTYSDGTTQKIDVVPAAGHAFGGDYTHVAGSYPAAHSQKCQRKDCDEIKTENCELETSILDGNSYYFDCPKCGEWHENVILTDKEVYASGEDIIVTVHPLFAATMGAKDWIGLYHKGEVPTQGGLTSIRWDYAPTFKDGKSIFTTGWHDRPLEDPDNCLKAGEYTLFLCQNDGYVILARTNFIVTTAVDESKTVTVQPTCTEDGYIEYTYTDGSKSREYPEELKATGHTPGDWEYDGVEKQTHTRACTADGCTYSESDTCKWDDGVETKPATETETGIKTYTCTVCNGTKTQEIPKVGITVTGTETVPATCEDAGYVRTHYSDGTYSDEVIPATGHDYSDWVQDPETKTHTKTCKNDEKHVITEDCTLTHKVNDVTVEHSCSVCNYSYTTGLLETDKKVYSVTDPIMVKAYDTFSGAWVGLYHKGEHPDPEAGGIESLFWIYVTEGMVGTEFDLTAVVPSVSSGNRGEKLGNGEYVLYFFGDSGYSTIVDEIELTVFTDMSNTEFELLFNGDVARENGEHEDLMLADVDDPADGEKVTLGVNVKDGEIGTSWIAVFEGVYDLNTNFNGMDCILYRYIADINGEAPFVLNQKSGGFEFYVGDFTIVIFADGGYSYPVKYMTFSVCRPVVSEVVRKKATCEAPGLKYVVYEDDGDPNTEDEGLVVIPALGHDLDELKCIEGTNTHGKACKREGCSYVETEDCNFVDGKCTVCNGAEAHVHALTRVAPVAATCTAAGNKEYFTCECGEYFSDIDGKNVISDKASVVIPAKGHTWTAATCSAPKTCSVCNTTEGAALGHDYGAWQYNAADKTHTKTCKNDAAHTETKACTFDTGVVVTEPAAGKEGEKKFTCTVCGGSYTEVIPALEAEGVQRVYGATRYYTAIEIANQLKENMGVSKFNAIVVASGTDFADALSGTYLANQKGAPVLLVRNRDQEMNLVKDYIKANLAAGGTVYILGGEKAVPKAMETGLEGFNVKRLGGATRYETNLLILKEAGVKAGEDILVCTGKDFPDSLAASAVNKPIVLVKDSLSATQQQYLNSVKGGKLYIIGGTAAVNARIETSLKGYGTTQRLSGATRYYTAVEIAKTFFPNTKTAVVAYGENFPDGMCGGTLAYSMGAPVLLTTNSKSAVTVDYTTANGIHSGAVLGGNKLISDNVVEKAFG